MKNDRHDTRPVSLWMVNGGIDALYSQYGGIIIDGQWQVLSLGPQWAPAL